jgi:hypothetical protein
MSTSTAIDLNNRGVAQMVEGNSEKAVGMFSVAANILLHTLETMPTTKNHFQDHDFKYEWVDCPTVQKTDDDNVDNVSTCSTFLFGRALKIWPSPDLVDEKCPCECSKIILFNLALARHLQAAKLGERGHQLLRRADQLYEMVKSLITADCHTPGWAMLLMAIHNNQGCIYHECAMYEESSVCLGRLATVLLSSPGVTGLSDWERFFLNILTLQRPTLAAAA